MIHIIMPFFLSYCTFYSLYPEYSLQVSVLKRSREQKRRQKTIEQHMTYLS